MDVIMTTMLDIAKKVGVSRSTVSFVLNKQDMALRISDKTKQRILEAAHEMGYRPYSLHKAIRAGRFNSLALMLSTQCWNSTVSREMLEGMYHVLNANDVHLMQGMHSDDDFTRDEFVPKVIRELMVDGLLINYTFNIPTRLIELIKQYDIPAVWLNSKQEFDSVRPDDFWAGKQATERLLAMGHERIVFATNHTEHYSAVDRYEGYSEAMKAAGLEPRRIREDVHSEVDWAARAHEWLGVSSRPTAIIADSMWATPTVFAALTLGLKVPEDLSVVAFAPQNEARMGIAIDTWKIPEYQMGMIAVEMLLQKVNDPQLRLPPRALTFDYWQGTTSAPPLSKAPSKGVEKIGIRKIERETTKS